MRDFLIAPCFKCGFYCGKMALCSVFSAQPRDIIITYPKMRPLFRRVRRKIMKQDFYRRLEESPVISAAKDINMLERAVKSPCGIIFMLGGDIFNLPHAVELVHRHGKMIFIHVDLIDGFSHDATALRYISENIRPDGIISTKAGQIKTARELGMLTVRRFFIIDSLSLDNAATADAEKADAVEIMPGVMPKIIEKLGKKMKTPLIAGGLISEKDDVIAALRAGAAGVSTTAESVWEL